jgi:hypothetical protein
VNFLGIAIRQACLTAVCFLAASVAGADEPKPTPANTITIQLAEPVKPQQFSRPLKIFITDVIDRSGNAQPMLVYKPRGGIFLDRVPVDIARAGLTDTLKTAGMLAPDRDSADFVMTVYLFNFGLNTSSGFDFFGKVELAAQLKNPKTNKSLQITASGTSIANAAFRKKNILKNVQENIEQAFADALRNLFRGEKLRDAVIALDVVPEPASAPKPAAPADSKPF